MILFCAEIGSCHRGIPSLAYEMIRQSSLAGADLCKFQLGHRKPYGPLESKQIARRWPTDNAKQLMEWCDFWNVEFFASIFTLEGLNVARSIGQKRYKFPSRKAFKKHSKENYEELLSEMMKDGKEVFASGQNVYVVPSYPQYPPITMPYAFSVYDMIGYSSHAHGYEDALIAIARGAKYIEKHVTLDKTNKEIKDNHFALSFKEFEEMTRIGRKMARHL